MKSNRKIGLFCPISQDLTPYINRLQHVGEIRLIIAGQTNFGPIDFLVLPDGVGVFPDTPGLSHNDRVYATSRNINPYFYKFWNESPFQNIIEERQIPVIGVGDSAAMIYSELGGRLFVNDKGEVELLKTTIDNLIFHGPSENFQFFGNYFECGFAFGASSIEVLPPVLHSVMDLILHTERIDEIEDNGDGEESVEVIKPTPYLPKIFGARNKIPQ